MHKTCTCIGNTNGWNCSRVIQCKLLLPRMTEVADKLKKLYERSVYSTTRNSLGVTKKIIVDRVSYQRVSPWQMVHFSHSPDYCMANSKYNIAGIEGRECTLKNKLSSQHCDNLCCDHGYENVIVTEKNYVIVNLFGVAVLSVKVVILLGKSTGAKQSLKHLPLVILDMISNSTMDITDYIHT